MNDINDDQAIEISVSGRFGVITIPWREAKERYLKFFPQSEQFEATKTLGSIGKWSGRIDGTIMSLKIIPK